EGLGADGFGPDWARGAAARRAGHGRAALGRRPAAVRRAVAVVDLEAEGADGGLVDPTAQARPLVLWVPRSRGGALPPVGGGEVLGDGRVPGMPGLALLLEKRERGVIPVVRRRAGPPAPDRRLGEDEAGRVLHPGLVAIVPDELLDEHRLGGGRGAGGLAGA